MKISKTILITGLGLALSCLAACHPTPGIPREVEMKPKIEYKTPEEVNAHRDESNSSQIVTERNPDGTYVQLESKEEKEGRHGVEDAPDFTASVELNLYRQINKGNKGFVFSPYSILDCFSLLYPVADGESLEQMDEILGFENKNEYFYRQYDEMKDDAFNIANALYYNKDYEDNLDFSYFDTDVVQEFISVDDINKFVASRTNNKIPNLLNEEDISPDMAMVLVNALYLNKKFLYPYEKSTVSFNDIESPSFCGEGRLADIKEIGKDIDLIRLPYASDGPGENQYALYIFSNRSDSKDAVSEYLDTVSGEELSDILDFRDYEGLSGYGDAYLNIREFELNTHMDITQLLLDMGLTAPFENYTDFSKALIEPVDEKGNDYRFCADKVIHESYIKTDNSGTEAAAATALAMKTSSASMVTEPTKVVETHNPFTFILKDDDNDTIIFMGRVVS